MQEPVPDGDAGTSEGIFVYTGSPPGISKGEAVSVTGFIDEYRPGGLSTGNLTITEFTFNPQYTKTGSAALPDPVIIGSNGRLPPDAVIDDDAAGSIETSGSFEPFTDGIDFYESLEGMLVEVQQPLAVGPTNVFGETAVVGDAGASATAITSRGSLAIGPGDFNPERILVDDAIVPGEPQVRSGAQFAGPITGVIDYSFGNFKLLVTGAWPAASGGVEQETAASVEDSDVLSIAAFNVENLRPNDPEAKFSALAEQIVNHLQAPDILGLQEVQDNSGATDNGVVEANLTYQELIDAIADAGGPAYQYRDIAPQDNQDGGQPGGNIRVGFLFRTDRGLSFIDRPGGTATTAVEAMDDNGLRLSHSPGRIDPQNAAFTDSRKPLAGEFEFNGEKIFVIVNHFNSKSGDDPLFGYVQPPVFISETQRLAQAEVVNAFVDQLLGVNPDAYIVVLGDLNDFQFSAPMEALEGGILTNLVEDLPEAERYTYLYDGNAQALDHILVSANLANNVPIAFDIVHLNAEFLDGERYSDHDPPMARFDFSSDEPDPPDPPDPPGPPDPSGPTLYLPVLRRP